MEGQEIASAFAAFVLGAAEQANDEGSGDNTLVTVAIGAAAVIVAAIIAAATATRNMGRQLSDAGDRFDRQLQEEASRLERQLGHDRDMREVEGLRRIIEEALQTGRRCRAAVVGWRDGSYEDQPEYLRADRDLEVLYHTLLLRLTEEHPLLSDLYTGMRELRAAGRAADDLASGTTREGSARLRSLVDDHLDKADAAWTDVVKRAREEIQVRLAETSA